MKITVAVTAITDDYDFGDCIHSIYNQRVIKSDEIRIYDFSTTPLIREISGSYGATVINMHDHKEVSKDNDISVFNYILNDNKDTDILIFIPEYSRIDASCISEMFRYFLKYDELTMVYGRQISDIHNNALARYSNNYFFPFVNNKKDNLRESKLFFPSNITAFRIKNILDIKLEPNSINKYFTNVLLAKKITDKGLRIKYNPFAITYVNSNISLLDVFKYSKMLKIFLNNNSDYKEFMNINSTNHEYFFSSFKNYLTINTSTPFVPYYATVCYLFSRIGETIGDFEFNHLKNSNLQKILKQKNYHNAKSKKIDWLQKNDSTWRNHVDIAKLIEPLT